MCGISGIVSKTKVSREDLSPLVYSMAHRGPDGSGHYFSDCGRVAFGHNMLSIIDVGLAKQPMTIEQGEFTISFNGEIFNSAEIRRILERDFGEKFDTAKSDTETVLRLYKHLGTSGFDMLNGMFAIAIFVRSTNKVILARDRFGIKPLFYAKRGDCLIFASETKALIPRALNFVDCRAIEEYVALGFFPNKATAYRGVKKLLPGEVGVYNLNSGDFVFHDYRTSERNSEPSLSVENIRTTIRNKLFKAVNDWQASEWPIAYSLSGGIDSTAIAAIASTKSKIDTFSVGFLDQDLQKWNELNRSRRISGALNSNHHEIAINMELIGEDILEILDILGEPFGGGVTSYFLFKQMAKKYKVAMLGHGGDEFFGNYSNADRYMKFYNRRKFHFQKYVRLMYLGANRSVDLSALVKFKNFPVDNLNNDGVSCLEESVFQFGITNELPNDFLYMTDLLSSAFGMEARTPYLDLNFTKFVSDVDHSVRCTPNQYKSLLIESLDGLIPEFMKNEAKSGFSLPLSLIMRKYMRSDFDAVMSKNRLCQWSFLSEDFFNRVIEPFKAGSNDFIEFIWRIFILQLWVSRKNPNFTENSG